MKNNKQLMKIWRENEKNTIEGVTDYNELSLKEKERIFDLIVWKKIDKNGNSSRNN